MIDRALERAIAQNEPGRSIDRRVPGAERCRSCRCIVVAPKGTQYQGVCLGQVAYVISCPSHYCRARAVALAERDAYVAARALQAEAELDAVYRRMGVI